MKFLDKFEKEGKRIADELQINQYRKELLLNQKKANEEIRMAITQRFKAPTFRNKYRKQ